MVDVDLDEPDCPEIYLGTESAPGFFAWLMPIGDRRARVGVCVDPHLAGRAPLHYLDSLLRGHHVVSRRLRRARIERKLADPSLCWRRGGPRGGRACSSLATPPGT